MTRPIWSFLTATLILAAAPPAPAEGRDHPKSQARSVRDANSENWGWVIVSGGNTSATQMSDLESVDQLRRRFGQDFVYFRDGRDHWVIRDRAMIDRALRTTHSMKLYAKELTLLARFQVEGALATAKGSRKVAAAIELQKSDGARDDVAMELERAIREMNRAIDGLPAGASGTGESRDLQRRSESLSRRLEVAVSQAQRDLRDLLREAKERHLAQRVD